jgi:hypothetical protein
MCSGPFSVRFADADGATPCPVCGGPAPEGRGPFLYHADHAAPLCRSCVKRLAPECGALLDLAATAERVGRHCRHLLTPPMETLLDLARAAENYVAGMNQPVS